ncbi:hypothetical protein CRM22_001637 [Opisthorchis felineus]|uniref:Macro domain-containing protein n=1 Tax=Opisthorchis felineus TaxID=147828 RepID=A0A4S2M9P4_OPIFE|nr:hypothetical protein CRM22_001637 [Opisthorchis felineus]TGZ73212.1 hypothetical protein CRM22_001637 [Opisthorchis felineus]TGZ73213.1 hypothetical protein CRM22_001637 [Opisthorchis felineus]
MSVITLHDIPPWNDSPEGQEAANGHAPSALGMRISLWRGDITKLKLDAIANAANKHLRGGGGVDGAIHRAAGSNQLHSACMALNGCPTGSAKITQGFALPAKFIIHCVGPYGENPRQLQGTYERALQLCTENNLTSIAFPCISTGVFHYPQEAAAKVAISTVLSYLSQHTDIQRVVFCVFLQEDYAIYKRLLPEALSQWASNPR